MDLTPARLVAINLSDAFGDLKAAVGKLYLAASAAEKQGNCIAVVALCDLKDDLCVVAQKVEKLAEAAARDVDTTTDEGKTHG